MIMVSWGRNIMKLRRIWWNIFVFGFVEYEWIGYWIVKLFLVNVVLFDFNKFYMDWFMLINVVVGKWRKFVIVWFKKVLKVVI